MGLNTAIKAAGILVGPLAYFYGMGKVLSRRRYRLEHFSIEYLALYINEPTMCKQFGCGKRLTMIEQLCGNLCLEHQPKYWGDDEDEMPQGDEGEAPAAG